MTNSILNSKYIILFILLLAFFAFSSVNVPTVFAGGEGSSSDSSDSSDSDSDDSDWWSDFMDAISDFFDGNDDDNNDNGSGDRDLDDASKESSDGPDALRDPSFVGYNSDGDAVYEYSDGSLHTFGGGDSDSGTGGTTSCVSNMGFVCVSSTNTCGEYNEGTVLCNGLCSVTTAPSVTSVYGQSCISAINECGDYAWGTKQCDNSCSVSTPPPVPAEGCTNSCAPKTGMSCTSAANACGDSAWGVLMCDGVTCTADVPPVPAQGCGIVVPPIVYPDVTGISITADPKIVRYGENTTIIWNGGNAGACTVTGYDLSANGVTGSEEVQNMEGESTYTLTCTLGAKSGEASVTVRVLPRVQET